MSIKLDIQTLSKWVEGDILSGVQKNFSGIGTDTRKELQDRLFIALRGERFDAHDYLSQAMQKKSAILLIDTRSKLPEGALEQHGVVLVSDTLEALHKLARNYRRTLKAKVVGITGSNGKTSTRSFLKQILERYLKSYTSQGSFNNHWGVPFSLLEADPSDEVCVLEMGMNHEGEIKKLVEIAEPDIVLVTCIGRAHVGNFADGIEGIARAKAEIFRDSPKTTLCLLNEDDPYLSKLKTELKRLKDLPPLGFSNQDSKADVLLKLQKARVDGLKITGQIKGTELAAIDVPIFGEHNVINLAAAAAAATALGLEPDQIWQVLPHLKTEWGRNQIIEGPRGIRILFDAYNANPDSMKALIHNLKSGFEHKRLHLVLGEMLELGEETAKEHIKLGAMVASLKPASVHFVGPSGSHFLTGFEAEGIGESPKILSGYKEELASQLKSVLNDKDVLVIKASRGIRLESLIHDLFPQLAEFRKQ